MSVFNSSHVKAPGGKQNPPPQSRLPLSLCLKLNLFQAALPQLAGMHALNFSVAKITFLILGAEYTI
jgi:hypothetical protein